MMKSHNQHFLILSKPKNSKHNFYSKWIFFFFSWLLTELREWIWIDISLRCHQRVGNSQLGEKVNMVILYSNTIPLNSIITCYHIIFERISIVTIYINTKGYQHHVNKYEECNHYKYIEVILADWSLEGPIANLRICYKKAYPLNPLKHMYCKHTHY